VQACRATFMHQFGRSINQSINQPINQSIKIFMVSILMSHEQNGLRSQVLATVGGVCALQICSATMDSVKQLDMHMCADLNCVCVRVCLVRWGSRGGSSRHATTGQTATEDPYDNNHRHCWPSDQACRQAGPAECTCKKIACSNTHAHAHTHPPHTV